MKVYAIKHKPTGEWMPARMSRVGRGGWSWWVPGPPVDGLASCGGFDKNPRVFFTRASAVRAVAQWLRGPMTQTTHTTGGDYFEPPDQYTTVDVVDDSGVPPRHAGDLEIVEGDLSL